MKKYTVFRRGFVIKALPLSVGRLSMYANFENQIVHHTNWKLSAIIVAWWTKSQWIEGYMKKCN